MNHMPIFIKTEEGFDQLGQRLQSLLNVAAQNRTRGQNEQKRYGINFGGNYYLFEGFGLELYLLQNEGEIEYEEYAQWPYYIEVGPAYVRKETGENDSIKRHLAEFLTAEGMEVLFW